MTAALAEVSGPVAVIDDEALRYNAPRPARARRRRPDPRREQVRARARSARRGARVCRAIAASSPSRFPRRSGSPRPQTTSCWATRRSTARRSPALAADETRRVADDPDDRRPRAARPRRRDRGPGHTFRDVRVAIDADASWRAPGLGHIGVRRSPLYEAGGGRRAGALASPPPRLPARRPDDVRGPDRRSGRRDRLGRCRHPLDAASLARPSCSSAAPRSSTPCTTSRRSSSSTAAAPDRSSYTASDQSVTEVTAGSGLLAGHLFDGYRAFDPAPAAAFALEVVRKPAPDVATVLGGGWIASGPALDVASAAPGVARRAAHGPREGAGEVQTPLRGDAARGASRGRPRVVPPLQERRARRARRRLPPGRRRSRAARAADLPRRREGVPVTRPGGIWRNWATDGVGTAAARGVPPDGRRGAARGASPLRPSACPVKAVGAGHSFTGIAVAPGVLLELRDLSGLVSVDVERGRVTLLAGTRLHRVPALLAPFGLAMENLGDIDRQSIAGAISTGTHGTGARFGGIAAQVVGATLVTAMPAISHRRSRRERRAGARGGARARRARHPGRRHAAVRAGVRAARRGAPEPLDDVLTSARRARRGRGPLRVLLVPAHRPSR